MSHLQTLTQALEKKRAELEKLQQEIEQAREKELTALPQQVGLETVDELIKALAAYASPRLKGLLAGSAATSRPTRVPRESGATEETPAAASGRRTRTTITDEIRQQVIALANDGKTGAEIAKAVGISLPSVANIKKAAGLTKKRSKA